MHSERRGERTTLLTFCAEQLAAHGVLTCYNLNAGAGVPQATDRWLNAWSPETPGGARKINFNADLRTSTFSALRMAIEQFQPTLDLGPFGASVTKALAPVVAAKLPILGWLPLEELP